MYKKLATILLFSLIGKLAYSQNDTIWPTDTLVDPSLFSASNILVNWELGFCPVDDDNDNGDTTFAPCYTVTYRDHYNTSIDICPDNLDSVGGIGLFNGTPRLLDEDLFLEMEDSGSNIISNQDNFTVLNKNLTSGFETSVSGANPSPKYCIEADLFDGVPTATWYHQFQILLGPIDRTGPSRTIYHIAETIGILTNGLVLEHTPPSSESTSALQGGIIPVDRCGWHPEPAGFGHFHAIPTGINVALAANGIDEQYHCKEFSNDTSGLVGFNFDGAPMYAPYDYDPNNGTTTLPNDLDNCYGHEGITPEYPNKSIYHYHASPTEIINNPPCALNYIPLEDTRFTYGDYSELTPAFSGLKEAEFVSLYPNPTSETLYIEGEYDHLSIFNETGKLLYSSEDKNTLGDIEINVINWNKGIYFVNASKNDLVYFGKFLVK